MLEPGLAFDDDGQPVPSVPFDYPEDQEPAGEVERDWLSDFDVQQFQAMLLTGSVDARQAGERLLLLAYTQRKDLPAAPQSLRELALRLNCCHRTAALKVSRFIRYLRAEYAGLVATRDKA